jgi:hypothetical protein
MKPAGLECKRDLVENCCRKLTVTRRTSCAIFFHLNGVMRRHNCRIWGSRQLEEMFQYQRDTAKFTVRCSVMKDPVIEPSLFQEAIVKRYSYLEIIINEYPLIIICVYTQQDATYRNKIYLEMLENHRVPQLHCHVWFPQDAGSLCQFLNERFPNKRIRRNSFVE